MVLRPAPLSMWGTGARVGVDSACLWQGAGPAGSRKNLQLACPGSSGRGKMHDLLGGFVPIWTFRHVPQRGSSIAVPVAIDCQSLPRPVLAAMLCTLPANVVSSIALSAPELTNSRVL